MVPGRGVNCGSVDQLAPLNRNQASGEVLTKPDHPPTKTITETVRMSDQSASRFAPQNKTTHERLSTNTVGLVALSDFRKRRAEVLEQQEREAREAAVFSRTNVSTPDRSLTATPNNASDNSEADRHRKKKKRTQALVSFGGEDEDGGGDGSGDLGPPRRAGTKNGKSKVSNKVKSEDDGEENTGSDSAVAAKESESIKITPNASVGVVPKLLTKAALRREVAEKEALRKEFLELQKAVKATDIAVPFVFYDGTNIPGGTVRAKKGDPVWLFLDKSRKVGAELGVGGDKSATARRDWARVGVDDLMLVRGSIIIPHVRHIRRLSYLSKTILTICSITISTFLLSTKQLGPRASPCLDTAPRHPLRMRQQIPPQPVISPRGPPILIPWRAPMMTPRSPKWSTDDGINATNTSSQPAFGKSSTPTRTTGTRSVAIREGMLSSSQSEASHGVGISFSSARHLARRSTRHYNSTTPDKFVSVGFSTLETPGRG